MLKQNLECYITIHKIIVLDGKIISSHHDLEHPLNIKILIPSLSVPPHRPHHVQQGRRQVFDVRKQKKVVRKKRPCYGAEISDIYIYIYIYIILLHHKLQLSSVSNDSSCRDDSTSPSRLGSI